jgi:hypothetical protein
MPFLFLMMNPPTALAPLCFIWSGHSSKPANEALQLTAFYYCASQSLFCGISIE